MENEVSAPTPIVEMEQPEPGESQVRTLGSYTILEKLETFGVAQAYVARRLGEIELCTLKVLRTDLEGHATAPIRFQREAQIAGHLEHPNIARMTGAGVEDEVFCIAFEFFAGRPLESLLTRLSERKQKMPVEVFAGIALAVLDGLSHAHAAKDGTGNSLGIVHRDLSPWNIVVSFAGEVKIADFGVARASVDDFKTAPGTAVGTLEYMSPEQVLSSPIDRRSDIYTVSVVFYEMLSGQRVVQSHRMIDILRDVAKESPPPLATQREDLPEQLAWIIEKGLSKDPDTRWVSAEELRGAIRDGIGRKTPATPDEIGQFMRDCLPEQEEAVLRMLDRIRALSDELDSGDGGGNLPTRLTSSLDMLISADPDEPPEPSVMTMPGAHLPAGIRSSSGVVGPRNSPAAKKQTGVQTKIGIGVVAAALVLGVAALLADPKPRSSGTKEVEAQTTAPTPSVREKPVVAKPLAQSPSAKTRAPLRKPPKVASTKTIKSTARPASKQSRKAKPVLARPPPAEVEAPPKAPEPRKRARYGHLRQLLTKLRASPKNAAVFEQLHAGIATAAKDLPPVTRRSVKADLDSAERAYDVELLARALNKLTKGR